MQSFDFFKINGNNLSQNIQNTVFKSNNLIPPNNNNLSFPLYITGPVNLYSNVFLFPPQFPMMIYPHQPELEFIQNRNIIPQNPIKENKSLTKQKPETDSDLIQFLSGKKLSEDLNTLNKNRKIGKDINISLGQIMVEKMKFSHFPIINLEEKNYLFSLPENVLKKGKYFTAVIKDKKNDKQSRIMIPDNFIVDPITYSTVENIIKENEHLYYQIQNIDIGKAALKKIVQNIYNRCLKLIHEIIRNVKNRKKKDMSEFFSKELSQLIKIHNDIYNIFLCCINYSETSTSEITSSNGYEEEQKTYRKLFLEENGDKNFSCELCGEKFDNHQGLGGHMSRNHPNKSEKYKNKLFIREKREQGRNFLENIKQKLFLMYNIDYKLMKQKKEKKIIKTFLKEHYKEYNSLKRKVKREKKAIFFKKEI